MVRYKNYYTAEKAANAAKQRCRVSQSQHLAVYAAANDNIWIRGAELEGKNVIWALQQQLQTTEKTHIHRAEILYIKVDISMYSVLAISSIYLFKSLHTKFSF